MSRLIEQFDPGSCSRCDHTIPYLVIPFALPYLVIPFAFLPGITESCQMKQIVSFQFQEIATIQEVTAEPHLHEKPLPHPNCSLIFNNGKLSNWDGK